MVVYIIFNGCGGGYDGGSDDGNNNDDGGVDDKDVMTCFFSR